MHLDDFDRCAGQFSNHQLIYSNPSNYGGGGGLSISPNSRFLYLTTLDTILQFDLNSTNIATSKIPVGIKTSGTEDFWLSQLAFDNKIYVVNGTLIELHSFTTINFPDSLGLSCNVQLQNLQLPNYCFQSLPNYPNYRLGQLHGSFCDTLSLVSENQPDHQTRLSVFPNPSATGIFNFGLNMKDHIDEIEIFDITGMKTFTGKNHVEEVDISNSSDGIYFYSVLTQHGKLFNGKIVKQ